MAGDLNADSHTAHTDSSDFRASDTHRSATEATKSLNPLNKRQVLSINSPSSSFKILTPTQRSPTPLLVKLNRITSDPWILEGYQLELVGFPYQDFMPSPPCWSGMNRPLIIDKVEKLIRKQAISLVTPVAGQFLSHIFTVPKKDSSQRLVVNLRPPNHFA